MRDAVFKRKSSELLVRQSLLHVVGHVKALLGKLG